MNSGRELRQTRRYFFSKASAGLGVAALAHLLKDDLRAADATPNPVAQNAPLLGLPHFAPKAKRVIYLFQSGGPSQMELFDYKPRLVELQKTELPDSVRGGQRLTGMTSAQTSFPVVPSMFKFAQHGSSGARVRDLMARLATVSDELCSITPTYREAITHGPAATVSQP